MSEVKAAVRLIKPDDSLVRRQEFKKRVEKTQQEIALKAIPREGLDDEEIGLFNAIAIGRRGSLSIKGSLVRKIRNKFLKPREYEKIDLKKHVVENSDDTWIEMDHRDPENNPGIVIAYDVLFPWEEEGSNIPLVVRLSQRENGTRDFKTWHFERKPQHNLTIVEGGK